MAKLINGNEIAQEILDEVAQEIKRLREDDPGFFATLAIVQVRNIGESPEKFA
jgi:5,10-methylene-tetrahydrofolate dehydrogenase/methenyl tetrahydrofolate cyclohydrolase